MVESEVDSFFAPYDDAFWAENGSENHRKAEHFIGKALYYYTDSPKRVLDVGCGTGQMLRGVKDAGAKYVLGIESQQGLDECRNRGILELDPIETMAKDLRYPIPKGVSYGAMPNLVVCVEVLEHLPEVSARGVVEWVCSLKSEWLAVSGAIPGGGGTGHINEHPGKYWTDLVGSFGTHRIDHDRSHALHLALRNRAGFRFFWEQQISLYRRIE